ncbi:YagK/YfjJ domain-containing protein [Acinetobacter dispersus]|uniref:YagK/YfjJ C-terminal domain-containing protein n=1 Tax=Acinetobacter dispersus TaxID=70348 RepID=N9LCX6_9GAMM|nr:inovirus-type Gp2 protein [Acinetobacter dispersus]ENW94098.1 hypothetical protein F904_01013 [Acinetobacter dispersus]
MNRSETLIEIEDLMLYICSGKCYWKEVQPALEDYRKEAIGIYDPELEYSPMLQGYFDLMSISRSSGLRGKMSSNGELFHSRSDFMTFNDELLDEHDRLLRRHRRQRQRNFKALKDDFETLLEKHCKLLLVRVDISYPYDTDMDIRQLDSDLNIFRGRIYDRQGCFNGVLDYSWAIEQGRDKGYHCHFLFIYNGSIHMCDGYYAEQIGKTWINITRDNGCYFSCHRKRHKNSYRRQGTLGIGMIHRNNKDEVKNALNAIRYLARVEKKDQYLRERIKGMRCFG